MGVCLCHRGHAIRARLAPSTIPLSFCMVSGAHVLWWWNLE